MNYLKYFEADNVYYSEITYLEFCLKSNDFMVDFTKIEIDKIKERIKGKKYTLEMSSTSYFLIKSELRFRVGKVDSIRVKKYSDEWYYVSVDLFTNGEYYKCDQLEGLVKLLNDIL